MGGCVSQVGQNRPTPIVTTKQVTQSTTHNLPGADEPIGVAILICSYATVVSSLWIQSSNPLFIDIPPESSPHHTRQPSSSPPGSATTGGTGTCFALPHSLLPPLTLPPLTIANRDSSASASIGVEGSGHPLGVEAGTKEEIESEDATPTAPQLTRAASTEKDAEDLELEAAGASSSSSSEDENDDPDEDEDDEDDEAELSPDRAREIALATAALIVTHTHPPKKVRGILSTSNIAIGLPRTLSASVMTLRKKGLRWNMTEGWSERASTPNAAASLAARNGLGGLGISQIVAAKHAGERWVRKGQAGEGNALHKTPHLKTRSLDMNVIKEVPPSPGRTKSATGGSSPLTGSAIAPGSPVSPNSSLPPIIAPRQYTSSARVAGSSSFKARLNSSNNDRGESSSLSQTLTSSTNFLLKLSPAMVINLTWAALQQLFFLYSKSARNIRDKAGAWGHTDKKKRKHDKDKDKGENGTLGSPSHSSLNGSGTASFRRGSSAGQDTSGHSFLASVGLESSPSSPPSSPDKPGHQITWIDLDSSCPMSLEEMNVFALHLVQKKLESFVQELSQTPQVQGGKMKLTQLLKSGRFTLFPYALPKTANSTGATTESTTPRTSAIQQLNQLNESEITDLFVKCTIQVMQEKLGKNNFGEIPWGGWLEHWREFASFYFLFRSDTNPDGQPPLSPTAKGAATAGLATKGSKEPDTNNKKGCAIM